DFAEPTAPTLANSSSTTRTRLCGNPFPYHSFGHCGAPHPESASRVRHSTNDRSGSQLAASHSRTSARTSASFGLLISNSPAPHQKLAMVARLAEKNLGALGALEP